MPVILLLTCLFCSSLFARGFHLKPFENHLVLADSLKSSPVHADLVSYIRSNSLEKIKPLRLVKKEDFYVFTEAPFLKIKLNEENGDLRVSAWGNSINLIRGMPFQTMKDEIGALLVKEKSVLNHLLIQNAYAVDPFLTPMIVVGVIAVHAAYLIYQQGKFEKEMEKMKLKCSTSSAQEAGHFIHYLTDLSQRICSSGILQIYRGQSTKGCKDLALARECFLRVNQSERGPVKELSADHKKINAKGSRAE